MPLESGLLEILACPACYAPLKEQSSAPQGEEAAQSGGSPRKDDSASQESAAPERTDEVQYSELLCTGTDCGLAYPVRDGIPVLLVDEARRPA